MNFYCIDVVYRTHDQGCTNCNIDECRPGPGVEAAVSVGKRLWIPDSSN
jgi:hypothetical protein